MQVNGQKYGVGIIGAGVIYESHTKGWSGVADRARCVGIAEIDPAKRAEATRKHFFPVDVEDYRKLLDRHDVDIVCVCTPPFTHEEIVRDALEAGKYVLCEKPLSSTLAGVDRIIEHAAKFPNHLSVVYQLRYATDMQKLQWLLRNECLGNLTAGEASRNDSLARSAAVSSGWWGRWNVSGGGVVMTQFIHQLDQLICVFGQPSRVTATMATEVQPIESEDTFSATIEFPGDVRVVCDANVNASKVSNRLAVHGEQLSVEFPWKVVGNANGSVSRVERELKQVFPQNASRSWRSKVASLVGKPAVTSHKPVNLHELYFRGVLDAIAQGTELPIGPEQARLSVELCTAIYTSAILGKSIELPLDSNTPFYEGVTLDDYRRRTAV